MPATYGEFQVVLQRLGVHSRAREIPRMEDRFMRAFEMIWWIVVAIAAPCAWAKVPFTTSNQGVLKDDQGRPVPDGDHEMTSAAATWMRTG